MRVKAIDVVGAAWTTEVVALVAASRRRRWGSDSLATSVWLLAAVVNVTSLHAYGEYTILSRISYRPSNRPGNMIATADFYEKGWPLALWGG